jgi:hypothetical protein
MRRPLRFVACTTLVTLAVSACWSIYAQEKKSEARAEFMRQKLVFSGRILEGLSREDYSQISKNAKALKALSLAAQWEEPGIGDANRYARFSFSFQDLTDELVFKAEEKSLDGSTLAYTQLVMSCVKCHGYVRHAKKP